MHAVQRHRDAHDCVACSAGEEVSDDYIDPLGDHPSEALEIKCPKCGAPPGTQCSGWKPFDHSFGGHIEFFGADYSHIERKLERAKSR